MKAIWGRRKKVETSPDATLSIDHFARYSETGRRKNNEDACDLGIGSGGACGLLALADGMGGHAGGEEASRLAVQTIMDGFARTDEVNGEDATAWLAQTILAAHEDIRENASMDSARDGMGSTIVVALFNADAVTVGHVGDSRAYQFRDGCVRRLTSDHLYVIEAMNVEENLAKRHPQGHVLAQALGVPGDVRPEVARYDARACDIFLLCTDGVSEYVTEKEMGRILNSKPLAEAVRAIVAAALENGSRDNCTVVVARVP